MGELANSVESLTKALADRLSQTTAQIDRTEKRRAELTGRGRLPKTGEEKDSEESASDLRVQIHRFRPLVLSDVPDTPENANEILCAFMFSAMEILAGIAENRRVPIAVRKDAAKILLESGLSTVPKKVQSVSASLNARSIEDFTKLFDKISPNDLSRLMDEPPSTAEDPPTPALGPMKKLPSLRTQIRAGRVRDNISLEDKILESVMRHRNITIGALADNVRGLVAAKTQNWRDVLESLVQRGILKIEKGPRGGTWVQLASAQGGSPQHGD